MKAKLLFLVLTVMLTACSGFQRTNESVVLSDNRMSDREFPIDNCLNYLLYKQDVSVAVLVGKVTDYERHDNSGKDEAWNDAVKLELIAQSERHLHDMANYYSQHSLYIVKRQRINMIAVDYDTSRLITVPEELRVELGRQTGATHIILLNLSRFRDGSTHTRDVTNRKLINVATGKVEAVDLLEERNPVSAL